MKPHATTMESKQPKNLSRIILIVRECILNAQELPIDDPRRPVFSQMSWINRLESVNVEAKPEYRDFNVNARIKQKICKC